MVEESNTLVVIGVWGILDEEGLAQILTASIVQDIEVFVGSEKGSEF